MELEAPHFFILRVIDPSLQKKGSIGRISEYINERINFSNYGDAVERITYCPTISERLTEQHRSNKNEYLKGEKRWFLTLDLDFDKAMQMDDWEYDKYILEGFLYCLERPGEVKGFDKAAFKQDIEKIIEAFLYQPA